MKLISIDKFTDKIIGKEGTPERDLFEYELQMDIIGDIIKEARKKKQLTKKQLAHMLGLRKAQVAKLEKSAKDFRIGIIMKALKAVDAKFNLNIEVEENEQLIIA